MKAENPAKPPHILFLFSDTGGGHRSAAEAIVEGLHLEFGERVTTHMVDIFRDYAPQPFNRMPELYPYMVRVPQAWEFGYRLSDGHRRAKLFAKTTSLLPQVLQRTQTLLTQHPSDMIVSVHPLANAPVLRAMEKRHPPFVTVVTDLVSTHALWYHPETDLCIVPTETALKRALTCGLAAEKVFVLGLPVADRFCQPVGDRMALREQLNWPTDRPVILLVGGGAGMGPLEETALAIASADMHITLVIVTGRNWKLKARLEKQNWPEATFIYGFVREMPDFMQAADILVTKAGPGTICEAFNAGLPLMLYSRLPGQEDGNVAYVTSHAAGVWADNPELVVSTLRLWTENPQLRLQAASASRNLARPQAARQIARLLAAHIGIY